MARLVIDTNIWISALLNPASSAGRIVDLAEQGRYTLLVSEHQFSEFRRVSRYAKLRTRFLPAEAGRLVRSLRKIGIRVDPLPRVDRSPDPLDNFLLAMVEAGNADFLITGDKTDLLALEKHGACQIVTIRQFLEAI